MFRSLCMLRLLRSSRSDNGGSCLPRHVFLYFSSPKAFSVPLYSTDASSKPLKSTIEYLANKLALSPEAVTAIAAKNRKLIPARLDSFVALFSEYGFTPIHITTVLTKFPAVLSKSQTDLRSKLEFFAQSGVSGQHLVEVISRDPRICERSLSNQIIPCVAFLRDFLGTTQGVLDLFMVKRGTWVLHKFSDSMVMNVELLRKYKVPDCNILKLIILKPKTLSRKSSEFGEIVEETVEMGFNPESRMFVYGLNSFASMKKDKWVSKLQVFKSFGWREDQLKELLLKQPQCMQPSEVRLTRALDFFLNELRWSIDDVNGTPIVLVLNIERRVLPRVEVLRVLNSKGLLKSKAGSALIMREDIFLKKYVMQYMNEVPQLLEIYKEKTNSVTAKDGLL